MTNDDPRTIDPDAVATPDRSDAVVITYAPAGRAKRRAVFEPWDGREAEYQRVAQTMGHDGWHTIGTELVEDLRIEGPRED